MNRINRRSLLKSGAAAAGTSLLLHHHAHAEPAPAPAGSLILETANRFLAALDAEQRAKATFPFDSDERMNWHFIPKVAQRPAASRDDALPETSGERAAERWA